VLPCCRKNFTKCVPMLRVREPHLCYRKTSFAVPKIAAGAEGSRSLHRFHRFVVDATSSKLSRIVVLGALRL
jgi:hypothetical protein